MEVLRAHNPALCYTGVCQSEGDKSFSRQGDSKPKKYFLDFFFPPNEKICRNLLLCFIFQIWHFATIEIRTKWKYVKLARCNFSNGRTGELILYLQNLREFLMICSFFRFCYEAFFFIADYVMLSKLISKIGLYHIAGFTCLYQENLIQDIHSVSWRQANSFKSKHFYSL